MSEDLIEATEPAPTPRSDPASASLSQRGWIIPLALALLSLQFLALGGWQAWTSSLAYDEPFYIASGVTALTRHDLRLNPEHPPLGKVLAALPVLAAGPEIPDGGQDWSTGYQDGYARQFLLAQEDRVQLIVFLGRLVPLLITMAIGLLMYVLAADLFGRAGGLLAAALWLTAPLVLGLGFRNGIDMPFTLATVGAAVLLNRYIQRGSGRLLAAIGAVAAAGALVRATGLVLACGIALVVAVADWPRLRVRALVSAMVVLLMTWGLLWGVYRGLAPDGAQPGTMGYQEDVAEEGIASDWRARLVLQVPWPTEYEVGLGWLAWLDGEAGTTYLLGQRWEGANWWYWPAGLAVKMPISALIVMVAGLLWWWAVPPDRRRRAALVLGVPAVLHAVVTLPTQRQIGLRYLLPVIALWLVAAAPLARIHRSRAGLAALAALVAVSVFSTWESHPHSMAWTAHGFRPGYTAISDSDLDWGQDFEALRAWAAERRPAVSYFGGPAYAQWTPQGYVYYTEDLPTAVPIERVADSDGWAAVSATPLTLHDSLSWVRAHCPVGNLGGSILLYRFEGPPDTSPGPDRPAAPCAPGAQYSTRAG